MNDTSLLKKTEAPPGAGTGWGAFRPAFCFHLGSQAEMGECRSVDANKSLEEGVTTMRKKTVSLVKMFAFAVASAAVLGAFAGPVSAQEAQAPAPAAAVDAPATLQPTDCIKCHKVQPETIAKAGARHATSVTCLDCHLEHPPWGSQTIPQCSMCHDPADRSHFGLDNCLQCHADPHQPLNIAFDKGEYKAQCLTCHEAQGKEMESFPSKHAALACNFCHEVHGQIPDCMKCHEPHVAGQTMDVCLSCHTAVHHPMQITYSLDTPREYCQACHAEIGQLLAQTTTKHQNFTCAFCHRGVHPTVPECRTCHGLPHGEALHARMPGCIECHNDSHFLQK